MKKGTMCLKHGYLSLENAFFSLTEFLESGTVSFISMLLSPSLYRTWHIEAGLIVYFTLN